MDLTNEINGHNGHPKPETFTFLTSKERVLTAFAHQEPDRAPIDYSANAGIDAELKKHFGDKLSFHGCISTAGPVAYGSVQDTIDNVRETLDTMKPGGGYAIAPSHALQDNSPVENVVAMYEAAIDFGKY